MARLSSSTLQDRLLGFWPQRCGPLRAGSSGLLWALIAALAAPGPECAAQDGEAESFAVPFSIAEAVTDPFLDHHTSTLAQWRLPAARHLRVRQSWDSVLFEWDAAPADGPVLSMERAVDLDCSRYDRLALKLSVPAGTDVVFAAETDRGPRSARLRAPAGETPLVRLDLQGAERLSRLRIELFAAADAPGTGGLKWIVLQDRERLRQYFQRWDFAAVDLSAYVRHESYAPEFKPTYGIFATPQEIDLLRAAHRRQVEDTGASSFTRRAEGYRRLHPEAGIHRYLFKHDEAERTGAAGFAATKNIRSCHDLALTAVVLQDAGLLRLAARHALSVAMCEYWSRDFTSHLPGGVHEDRSFRRANFCRVIARTMDLAGEMLSDAGRAYLLRRLAEEGIGRLNYVFWRFDYVHSSNQGPCFSAGRLPAYLVLERNWPRVRPYTELAFEDVLGFYESALVTDGGYMEGPTYLNMALHYALMSTDLYARGRGLRMRDLAPPILRQTADYMACVSSTLPDRDVIPLEDSEAHMGMEEMLAMSQLAPGSYWVTMCRKALARDGYEPRQPSHITMLQSLPLTGPAHPAFVRLPETRLVASLRYLDGEPVKWLMIGNKGDAPHTHEHEDRGSFVLEFAGDRFAADLGSQSYDDANHILAKQCQLHNMLVPTGVAGRPQPARPILADIDPVGAGDEAALHVEMDLAPGWEGTYRRWVRRWDSPDPEHMTISDRYALERGDGVAFYWQTYLPCSASGRTVTIRGTRGTATLEAPAGCVVALERMPSIYGRQHTRIAMTRRGRQGEVVVQVRLRPGHRPLPEVH